jgi:hypothetical protein
MIALSSANSCKNITGAYTPHIMLTEYVALQCKYLPSACCNRLGLQKVPAVTRV